MYRRNYFHYRAIVSLAVILACIMASLAMPYWSVNAEDKTTPGNSTPASPKLATENLSERALSFEANQGQTDSRVKFLSRGSGYTLFLTPTEAVLSLRQKQDKKAAVVRMKLVGANSSPEVVGQDQMPGKANYFNGNDRAGWRSNVSTYAKVHYREVYPGIDQVYYGKQQQLEYDFIVAPNRDPRKIRIAFSGARGLTLDETGDLVLETGAGQLRQKRPVAFQEIDGRRQLVPASYVLHNHKQVGFALGDYDPAKPLVIDPEINYSTYLGGSGEDNGYDIAVDATGKIYVTGRTASVNFPINDAIKDTLTGMTDAFISVINPALGHGHSLVFSTYWGQASGTGSSEGRAIAVNSTNAVFVVGVTTAQNFPTTPGSLQPAYQAFSGVNGFMSMFDLTTGTILYSTYLMGNNVDEATDVAVDGSTVYIAGQTASTNFPNTPARAYQINNAGGFDGFLMKLQPGKGSTYLLRYATYLGGVSTDCASNIAVDLEGNVNLTGTTQSADWEATAQYEGFPVLNAYQSEHGGGTDAFLTKINTNGIGSASLLYSTYLGGNGNENAVVQLGGIAVDKTTLSQVYVTGTTNSLNFPLRFELDGTLGNYDVFVTRIDTSQSGGVSLLFSTFLGGAGLDYGNDIAVDQWGRVFVTGGTNSNDYPVQCGSAKGPSWDGFITMLQLGGSEILFSTHLGGDDHDQINGIAVDSLGTAYVTGQTYSWGFPFKNGFQPNPAGFWDAFVTKITPWTC